MLMKFKTGLVLSGGGTRGFAHIGALQALEEAGYQGCCHENLPAICICHEQ